MSRDKQIEEMAKDIQLNMQIQPNPKEHPSHQLARLLVEDGYRKASEVAEEIFKEIEKLLRVNQVTLIPPFRSEITDWKTVFRLKLADDIAELKKKYTENKGE